MIFLSARMSQVGTRCANIGLSRRIFRQNPVFQDLAIVPLSSLGKTWLLCGEGTKSVSTGFHRGPRNQEEPSKNKKNEAQEAFQENHFVFDEFLMSE